jgi:hypothetical protein
MGDEGEMGEKYYLLLMFSLLPTYSPNSNIANHQVLYIFECDRVFVGKILSQIKKI